MATKKAVDNDVMVCVSSAGKTSSISSNAFYLAVCIYTLDTSVFLALWQIYGYANILSNVMFHACFYDKIKC